MLTRGMISLKPNSGVLLFPLDMQRELLRNMNARDQETRDQKHMLVSGIKMTAVSRRGGVSVETESLPQFVDKDFFDLHRNDMRVPLLDTNNGSRGASIAGVMIDSLHQPITNPLKRAQIEEAIGRKLINAQYFYQQNGQG